MVRPASGAKGTAMMFEAYVGAFLGCIGLLAVLWRALLDAPDD